MLFRSLLHAQKKDVVEVPRNRPRIGTSIFTNSSRSRRDPGRGLSSRGSSWSSLYGDLLTPPATHEGNRLTHLWNIIFPSDDVRRCDRNVIFGAEKLCILLTHVYFYVENACFQQFT